MRPWGVELKHYSRDLRTEWHDDEKHGGGT